ncbi:MAG: hypothetical protein Kow00120_05620 [Anaerolineae bacterium]
MTREFVWMGLLGTLLVAAVLGIVALREPARQAAATAALQAAYVAEGTDRYAAYCAACHGAAGEGLGANPPLNGEGVRAMDAADLERAIARGRYGTQMAAFGADEGGIFTGAQVDTLVAVIQYGDWEAVAARVEALGLTPPEVVTVEVTDEILTTVQALPGGDAMARGLMLYAESCVACHGGNGEGTSLAPALNDADLRARLSDADIARVIAQGTPGTLMAAWDRALSDVEIADLTALVRGWAALDAAGIALPVVESAPVDMSPEAVAAGGWLYGILCAQCHGADGYGTALAPALNNRLFLSETPDAAIQQIIGMGVPGTSMPAWAGRLTEADIAALTAYLRSWEPSAPAIVAP